MLKIDDIVARVRHERSWSAEEATRYANDYLDFLSRAISEPSRPSAAVDAIWHAHILHTRRYRADCHRLAGRFIDHEPAKHDSDDCTPSGPVDPGITTDADCTPPVGCDSSIGAAVPPSLLALADCVPSPSEPSPQCTRPGPVPNPPTRS